MQELYVVIGKRITKERLRKNLSQEYLAEITNLHRNYIGYIERGEKHASIDTLLRITKALNISLEWLFRGF